MSKQIHQKDILSAEHIREMSDTQIQIELDKLREGLWMNRRDLAVRKLTDHQIIQIRRRNIARLLTVQREREIEAIAAEIVGLQGAAAGGQ